MMRKTLSSAGVAIGSMALLVACTPDRPEHGLREAAERVSDAREHAIDRATDMVDELEDLREERSDVAEERAEVAEATEKLGEAGDRLDDALGTLEERADDVAIFRSLQRSLLDAGELSSIGIVAEVNDRTVTLRGEVADAEHRKRAVEIARNTAGVLEVRDEMTLVSGSDGENGAS